MQSSRDHRGKLLLLINKQLDPGKWCALQSFGLDTGTNSLRFPDLLVDRAGGYPDDRTATEAALLVEVSSPETEGLDLREKPAEYLQLPSLLAYLVFAQSHPKVWTWMRAPDSLPSIPDVTVGLEKTVHVPGLNLTLPLREVYAGAEPR